MPNQYVNKVDLADGTTLIDLSSDTAVATDVAAGKYFHLATGERVAGSATGGTGAISIVDTADAAGGTVRTITALDISDTTAAAGDVVAGKYFYTASGTKTQGTIATKTSSDLTASTLTVTAPAGYYASAASKTLTDNNLSAGNIKKDISIFGVTGSYEGSGGGGLVYETGTYTPTSDATQPTISFANSHTTAPFYILMSDAKNDYGTSGVTNTNMAFEYVDWWQVNGAGMYYSSSTRYYGVANYWYRSSNASQFTTNRTYFTHTSSESGSGNAYPEYWATNTAFMPYTNSTSRYWKSGRPYKWIAVWKPTT